MGCMPQLSPREQLRGAPYGSRIVGEDFSGADLISLFANQLWFDRCRFSGTDLRYATLDRCHFRWCDLRRADLRGSSARFAGYAGCNLRDADLRECDLTGAEFTYVNTGTGSGRTDVTGVSWSGAVLSEARWNQVIGWPDTAALPG
jgi:uncharacterized protein YjbI with pentapeptide repeats